jgi:spoIIIJ-associated protein
MEWVETTGRTIDEARELALDQLGVHEEDAEFDVLEEPRPGLFGRIRGEARVRARVRPTQPRPKTERRDRKRKPRDGEAAPAAVTAPTDGEPETSDDVMEPADAEAAPAPPKPRSRAKAKPAAEPAARSDAGESADDDGAQQAERDAAAAFLQGLADALGEPAQAEIVVVGEDEAEVRLEGGDLGLLIGPRGQTLLAVQDLTRLASQKRGAERHGRLRIDIAGYRERRKVALARFTEQVADEVRSSGTARALEPMSSMDRKIVHDAVNELDGVDTVSEGEEPFRRVVIRPSSA